MPDDRSRKGDVFHRLWRFVKRQVVDDAPEDMAICQFDCRKEQCQQEEWATCDRRISKGAGELFPGAPGGEPPSSEARKT
jgi:hypothetical protein